jgi:hypothetical protein
VITIKSKGSFRKTERFLKHAVSPDIFRILDGYGRKGVAALSAATPVASGLTANSWTYEVNESRGSHSITWRNSHVVDGVPVVILLQYGHGTGTGGYVQGKDFINPALKPIFDEIANSVWKAVTA